MPQQGFPRYMLTWSVACCAPSLRPCPYLLRQSRNTPQPTQAASTAAPTAATRAIHHIDFRPYTAAPNLTCSPIKHIVGALAVRQSDRK